MTSQTPRIRILSERSITTSPRAGEESLLISIVYQVPPKPPQTLLVSEDQLPDLVFRRENPGVDPLPENIQEAGDNARRELIRADMIQRPIQEIRTI